MDKSEKDDLHFDELKSLWQNNLERDAAKDDLFNDPKILTIMQKKVSSAMQSVLRNLLIEILITNPLVIGIYLLFDASAIHLPIFVWIGFFIIASGYQVYLYCTLENNPVPTTAIRETIQKQRAKLKGFIQLYHSAAIIGGIIFGGANGLTLYTHFAKDNLMYIPALLLSLASGYGFYAAVQWYTQKLYGQHYTTLEASEKVLEQI